MKQIFIKLQTPTVELKIQAKDAAGTKDSFIAGFKRYNKIEGSDKANQFDKLQKELFLNLKLELKEQSQFFDLKAELQNLPEPELTKEEADKEITDFIKNEILYLKDIKVNYTDDVSKTDKELTIADTRTVKVSEGLWTMPEECLELLIDSYLASVPYRQALIEAQQRALLNIDTREAAIKN